MLFIHSIIGYGIIFLKITNKEMLSLNIGYIGITGFFFISLISIFSSFFFAHNYSHNLILHGIGIISFLAFIDYKKRFYELKLLWLLILILWIGIYAYKNHDDFPYYHLTYALNLSENSFTVGTGHFSHGFRTFSSLFFFHSILYMPFIEFYLFHSGPFYILIFFNLIIIFELLKNYNNKKTDLLYFFSILSLLFINIAFYRIAEHGTDRSAQILLILIFILFFDISYIQMKKKEILLKTILLIILIFLSSSMKVIYYLYLLLIPVIFFKKKLFQEFLVKKNILIIFFVSISFFLNLTVNYLNTGCFLYPAEKTCVYQQDWSIKKKEVKRMSLHYEWWSKAGGGPGYVSEIEPEEYVKSFNWVKNWIERHFFNKVSDTLSGIIFISVFVTLIFKFFSQLKTKINRRIFLGYLIPLSFLLEWFLNHPSMRYGGYVLFAIPIFLFTAQLIEKYKISKKALNNLTIFFIFLSFISYNTRNIIRIDKEASIYNYNVFKSPYFFVKKTNVIKIKEYDDYTIYSTKNGGMCWATKTPCSYNRNIDVKNFLWMNMIYLNDE